MTVKDEQLCQLRCFVEETCKSYNLGPPESGGEGKRVCELSSSHHVLHPDYLVSKSGFIYRPSVFQRWMNVQLTLMTVLLIQIVSTPRAHSYARVEWDMLEMENHAKVHK